MSILGSILSAPASAPGTSTSLGGDLIQFGAGLFGNWANSRSQARAQRQANRRERRLMQQSPVDMSVGVRWRDDELGANQAQGGNPLSILDANAAYVQANYTPSAAPYVEGGYRDASNPLVVGGALALAGARALVATPAVRALVSFFSRYVAPAAAVELVSTLISSGHLSASAGPYANAKHNRVTGIMRGDLMAMRRVKRSAKRLQKAIRLAGVGVRRGGARFRRKRSC